jgi:ribonuclease H
MTSVTIPCNSEDALEKIKKALTYSMNVLSPNQYELFRVQLFNKYEKITIIGYKGKILLQGIENSIIMADICKVLNFDSISIQPKNIREINKRIHIGLDECGKGEAIGSMFQCAVLLAEDDRNHLSKIVTKDSKQLTEKQIEGIFHIIEQRKIKFLIRETRAIEIDENRTTINNLMDRKNIEMISGLINGVNISDCAIIIDDYKPNHVLKQYINKLGKNGIDIIIESGADENYLASRVASIIARRHRNDHIDYISNSNKIELGNGQTITLGTDYKKNMLWIETFLIMHPTLRLPHFIRTSWKDVESTVEKHPRKIEHIFYNCPTCKKNVSLLFFDRVNGSLHSSCCFGIVDDNFISSKTFSILPDTSAVAARVFSKIYENVPNLLRGKEIILPHAIETEIDTLSKTFKAGAHKELEYIRELADNDVLSILPIHYDLKLSDIEQNITDKKIADVIAYESSAMLITQDGNMAANANGRGTFTIRIINSPYQAGFGTRTS